MEIKVGFEVELNYYKREAITDTFGKEFNLFYRNNKPDVQLIGYNGNESFNNCYTYKMNDVEDGYVEKQHAIGLMPLTEDNEAFLIKKEDCDRGYYKWQTYCVPADESIFDEMNELYLGILNFNTFTGSEVLQYKALKDMNAIFNKEKIEYKISVPNVNKKYTTIDEIINDKIKVCDIIIDRCVNLDRDTFATLCNLSLSLNSNELIYKLYNKDYNHLLYYRNWKGCLSKMINCVRDKEMLTNKVEENLQKLDDLNLTYKLNTSDEINTFDLFIDNNNVGSISVEHYNNLSKFKNMVDINLTNMFHYKYDTCMCPDIQNLLRTIFKGKKYTYRLDCGFIPKEIIHKAIEYHDIEIENIIEHAEEMGKIYIEYLKYLLDKMGIKEYVVVDDYSILFDDITIDLNMFEKAGEGYFNFLNEIKISSINNPLANIASNLDALYIDMTDFFTSDTAMTIMNSINILR